MPTAYLQKRSYLPQFITEAPHPQLGIVVVIPCFNEPDLIGSLEALLNAESTEISVEVIVIVNDGEDADERIKVENDSTFQKASDWAKLNSTAERKFHIYYAKDLPRKKAGVGLARKIGMDEAARRLELVGNPKGIITGFDADSRCTPNYFHSLRSHFDQYPDIQAASLWYEHPLEGTIYDLPVYQAIAEYELHLRYFTLAKRWAGYPLAFETIGSSMAVRADAYQQQGGMNTRKAGEDFYFLNKFIVNESLNELNTTTVIPSPRISDRVPFGTGKAIGEIIKEGISLKTYAPETFKALKSLTSIVPQLYEGIDPLHELPEVMVGFLRAQEFEQHLSEIRKNTTDLKSFTKRFYRWFDPFLLMKFAHYSRDHFYPNVPVKAAGRWILEHYFSGISATDLDRETSELLKLIRVNWLKKSKH